MRPEDNDTKRDSIVEIELLAKEGKLTEIGREYVEGVCNEMQKIEFNLDFTELEAEILKFLPIEQWLISIELVNNAHMFDKLIYILLVNMPFLQITPK